MMNWMLRACTRASAVTGLLAALTAVTAQAQTPEGTVITNTATVNWTDANGNAYSPMSASVDITVGFKVGIDVTSAGNVSPASPSSGNSIAFDITNIGNGDDSVVVDTSFTTAGVVAVTEWQLDGTPYPDLGALNTALSTTLIAQGASVTVEMVFDVNPGQGAQSVDYTLTATSRRAPGPAPATDSDVATIAPPALYAATVTPDGSQNLQLLPTNGTNETFTFRVTNSGNIADDFDLTASNPGTAITIVSVNGAAGTTDQINLVPGAFADIVVEYQVGDVPANTADTLVLAASPVSDPTNDDGFADMTVIRPVLTITKAAYRDDQTTLIGAGDTVVPSDTVQYLVTVTNNGSTDAESVHVDDTLPGEVALVSTSANVGTWSISNTGNDVDADLTGTLASGASVSFWIRVRIN
jgi:uncharacterized repeat protein (TIGR01451 family)